jgi:hypothetical protein
VVDEELAAAVEEVAEGLLAARALEDVFLLDALPRELLALARQLVAGAGELLLLGEQLLARGDPLVVADGVHIPSGPRSSPGSPPGATIARRAR